MDPFTRLRRVTDLFAEGTELHLGYDEDRKPVVIWINKLNSFEVEEARRDGIVERGRRVMELSGDDSSEWGALRAEMTMWSREELNRRYVDNMVDELYMQVVNDLETDPEMAEKLERLRRLPAQFNDAQVPDDDPRRKALLAEQTEYLEAIRKGQAKKREEALRDVAEKDLDDVKASFTEKWRQRQSLDEFMEQRRRSELYFAMRECNAVSRGTTGPKITWDHQACDHSQKFLPDRASVTQLPDSIVEQVISKLDDMTASARESGNSGAPASSSASSEPARSPEASSPSTPAETPPGVPTT